MDTPPPPSVRGEPDYMDQVPRMLAWAAAHPVAQITYHAPRWQAIMPEPDGEMVVVRSSLRQLMDRLESLTYP